MMEVWLHSFSVFGTGLVCSVLHSNALAPGILLLVLTAQEAGRHTGEVWTQWGIEKSRAPALGIKLRFSGRLVRCPVTVMTELPGSP